MSPALQRSFGVSTGFRSMWKQGCPALPGFRFRRPVIFQRSKRGRLHSGRSRATDDRAELALPLDERGFVGVIDVDAIEQRLRGLTPQPAIQRSAELREIAIGAIAEREHAVRSFDSAGVRLITLCTKVRPESGGSPSP